MHNWCGNTMTVTGEPDKVSKFAKDFTEKGFACIGDVYILSSGSENTDETWYKWRMEFWGVKWNIDDSLEILEEDTNRFVVWFQTAGRDPEEFIKRASFKYKVTIENQYDEPGMGFYGYYKVIKGVIDEDYCINDNDFNQEPEMLEKIFGSVEQAYDYFNDMFEEDMTEEIIKTKKYLKGLL